MTSPRASRFPATYNPPRKVPPAPLGAEDPWARSVQTGQMVYDEHHFYLRATDSRGHGEKVTVQFPPEILAQMAKLIKDDRFPYESAADFCRDAVVHLMARRQVDLNDPNFRETFAATLANLEWQRETDRMEAEVARWQSSLDQFRGLMAQLDKIGAYGQMDAYIHRQRHWMDTMSEPYVTLMGHEVGVWEKKIKAAGSGG